MQEMVTLSEQMEDSLSKRYLLYLRDMSRKIVYGAASSAGDYSQVLIRGFKKIMEENFQG